MKILPCVLFAAILAGTAMAEPAPGTSPPEVLTKDESAALIQSHIDRLDRLEPVTLNQDERAFLTKYREEAAAQAQKEAEWIEKSRAIPLRDGLKEPLIKAKLLGKPAVRLISASGLARWRMSGRKMVADGGQEAVDGRCWLRVSGVSRHRVTRPR